MYLPHLTVIFLHLTLDDNKALKTQKVIQDQAWWWHEARKSSCPYGRDKWRKSGNKKDKHLIVAWTRNVVSCAFYTHHFSVYCKTVKKKKSTLYGMSAVSPEPTKLLVDIWNPKPHLAKKLLCIPTTFSCNVIQTKCLSVYILT